MISDGAGPPRGWRRRRRVIANISISAVVLATMVIGVIYGLPALRERMQSDDARVIEAFRAANRGDVGGFQKCFDRLPPGSTAGPFLQSVSARYGKFQSARQLTRWSEPIANHLTSARFQLQFDRAAVQADVTIRTMVDEASATGDLDFLGQTRIVKCSIRDSAAGDLTFPP